jgi:hypothetical protein
MSSLYRGVDFPIGFVRRLRHDMIAAPFPKGDRCIGCPIGRISADRQSNLADIVNRCHGLARIHPHHQSTPQKSISSQMGSRPFKNYLSNRGIVAIGLTVDAHAMRQSVDRQTSCYHGPSGDPAVDSATV